MASTATQTAKSKTSNSDSGPRQSMPEHTRSAEYRADNMDPSDMGEDRNQQEIARLAYSYWEAREGGNGSAEGDWLRAEAELSGSARARNE